MEQINLLWLVGGDVLLYILFPKVCAKLPGGNWFAAVGVQIAESATALLDFNAILLEEDVLEFFQGFALEHGLGNGLAERVFLRFKYCSFWSETSCFNLLIFFIQLGLPFASCPVFLLGHMHLSGR